MSSKYYSQMFSGEWQENDKVIIENYSYDVYYSYLRMLHTGYIRINQSNIAEFIDLANCYGDERLMKHCQTFIQNHLNEKTLSTYLPLINKYKLDEMNDKLVELTIKDVLPKNIKQILSKFFEMVFSNNNLFLKNSKDFALQTKKKTEILTITDHK
ncbi:RCC1 and BTB domain-containing protein 1 [Dermatophagoides pteronyssinus]|uniref:RCC1 and BTB domain-containing protein 1 n=1 Tax=Dermatophagoides pteronyssinus TaxID=6956 RepID=A0ABQ8IVJ9_DERPT|nr:RCC1 and BTB domain-containing protein 1 [Dermatophagoides pteronyssinus]